MVFSANATKSLTDYSVRSKWVSEPKKKTREKGTSSMGQTGVEWRGRRMMRNDSALNYCADPSPTKEKFFFSTKNYANNNNWASYYNNVNLCLGFPTSNTSWHVTYYWIVIFMSELSTFVR
jgi:hypothetical protein